jgi:uncharacterized membrane protein YhaH (DUF805 family)
MADVKIVPTLSLFGHALIDWVDIGGRARRSELLLYWTSTSLILLMLTATASLWLPGWREQRLLELALGGVQALPMMAIFIRRLHDQDRAAWWVLLMPPVLLDSLSRQWRFANYDAARLLAAHDPLPFWIHIPLVLAILSLYIVPGTIGPNRYGADPREADQAIDADRRAAS